MSDLQILLIIIGALIIVVILVINWWQERRFRKHVENSFSPARGDALLDESKLDVTEKAYDTDDEPDISDETFEHNIDDDQFEVISFDIVSIKTPYIDSVSKHNEVDKIGDTPDTGEPAIPDTSQASEPRMADSYQFDTEVRETQPSVQWGTPNPEQDGEGVDEGLYGDVDDQTMTANTPKDDDSQDEIKVDKQKISSVLPAILHTQIDLVALLYLGTDIPASDITDALLGLLDDYDKPVFVHVLDAGENQWYLLTDVSPNQRISRVVCSIQLADRGGALSRQTLNRFHLAVDTLGATLTAHVEWQGSSDVIGVATALDAFCIDVDKTIGLHILHGENNGAFTGTKLRGLAESQGMTLATNGTFEYFIGPDHVKGEPPSFIMFNREDHPFGVDMLRTSVIKGVTLQMDIPHTRQCTEVFSHMVQVAKQMQAGLNAVLVDDGNKVLSDIQIEKIRQQLKVIHATMLVRGIAPGSESARRLFS